MSGRNTDEVTDCAAKRHGGQCQVTFGDIKYENGKPVPVESVITGEEDQMTCQCLDYVFVIDRHKDDKRKPVMQASSIEKPDNSVSRYTDGINEGEILASPLKGGKPENKLLNE